MLRIAKWVSPVMAFGLVMALVCGNVTAEDKAAEKKEVGTISGAVVDAEGNPAAGAQVRLMHAGARKKDSTASGEKKAKELAEGDKPEKKEKPTPVATTTADDAGKFTLNDVPVGSYVVQAGVKGKGGGREKVEVKAGETAEVKVTLSMKAKTK